jgi:serine/threonine protein kinase
VYQNVEVQIVRKRLKSKLSTAVAREKKCLRLLNQLRHPNIIKLLGSYTYRGEFYLMFPYIDMDLECFFETKGRFGEFRYDFTFYSALRGLSSALSKTHRLHLNQEDHQVGFEAIGYHHDLRPKNVLVSKDTFILADFGLSDLKPADAQSQTPPKAMLGDYLAPECWIEHIEREDVGRSIDVWAFGCLLADVATYMRKGTAGIQEFARKRRTPGRLPRWEDSVFYRSDGYVKDEVSAWLKALPHDNSGRDLILPLVELSLSALIQDPGHRPKITKVYETLTFLSLQAHFFAVRNQFSAHIEEHKRPTAYNLWFSQERFHAWSRALCLEKDNPPVDLSVLLDKYDKFIVHMVDLFHQLQRGIASSPIDPKTASVFETAVDQLIENLWDLLPADSQGIGEAFWHQAILNTDDRGVLKDVDRALKRKYVVYDIAHAMTVMRKIRLDILHYDSLEGATEACTIALSDITFGHAQTSHEVGQYREHPVLIERMGFASDKVSAAQRKLIAGLKAESLGIEPKPKGLRTMHCIGTFEESGNPIRYGFVYRYPQGVLSDPTTLHRCLDQGEKNLKYHPLLGDKFHLAFALADFLKEFHTIGWLHENFNSHNILFFQSSDTCEVRKSPSSSEMQQPYVVGLHKSRPDGDFWQTEGPVIYDDQQDYQHPKYASTGRFCQEFDYYSLGIVLLEIGLWRPLSSLLKEANCQNQGLVQIRQELIKVCQTRLGAKMGAVYKEAVLQCMDSDWCEPGGGAEVRSDRKVSLRRFTEEVVRPLGRLAVASI